MKFLSPEVALYLYNSSIQPCMEYCCHVWAGAPGCDFEMIDKLQNWLWRSVGPWLAASLEPLAHSWKVASLTALVGFHQNYLDWFHFLILEWGLLAILIDCTFFLSPIWDGTRMSISTAPSLVLLHSRVLCPYNAFLWPMI